MCQLRSLLEDEIPHLRRYARALVHDAEEADDLVQACLERALQKAHQWDPERRLRPWLFRIQHNLFVSWIRRRERERNYRERSLPVHSIEAGQEAGVAVGELMDALRRLPYEQSAPLLMVTLEGLSYQEVSDVLSVPVGTVRSRLSRGREALREALAGSGAARAAREQSS